MLDSNDLRTSQTPVAPNIDENKAIITNKKKRNSNSQYNDTPRARRYSEKLKQAAKKSPLERYPLATNTSSSSASLSPSLDQFNDDETMTDEMSSCFSSPRREEHELNRHLQDLLISSPIRMDDSNHSTSIFYSLGTQTPLSPTNTTMDDDDNDNDNDNINNTRKLRDKRPVKTQSSETPSLSFKPKRRKLKQHQHQLLQQNNQLINSINNIMYSSKSSSSTPNLSSTTTFTPEPIEIPILRNVKGIRVRKPVRVKGYVYEDDHKKKKKSETLLTTPISCKKSISTKSSSSSQQHRRLRKRVDTTTEDRIDRLIYDHDNLDLRSHLVLPHIPKPSSSTATSYIDADVIVLDDDSDHNNDTDKNVDAVNNSSNDNNSIKNGQDNINNSKINNNSNNGNKVTRNLDKTNNDYDIKNNNNNDDNKVTDTKSNVAGDNNKVVSILKGDNKENTNDQQTIVIEKNYTKTIKITQDENNFIDNKDSIGDHNDKNNNHVNINMQDIDDSMDDIKDNNKNKKDDKDDKDDTSNNNSEHVHVDIIEDIVNNNDRQENTNNAMDVINDINDDDRIIIVKNITNDINEDTKMDEVDSNNDDKNGDHNKSNEKNDATVTLTTPPLSCTSQVSTSTQNNEELYNNSNINHSYQATTTICKNNNQSTLIIDRACAVNLPMTKSLTSDIRSLSSDDNEKVDGVQNTNDLKSIVNENTLLKNNEKETIITSTENITNVIQSTSVLSASASSTSISVSTSASTSTSASASASNNNEMTSNEIVNYLNEDIDKKEFVNNLYDDDKKDNVKFQKKDESESSSYFGRIVETVSVFFRT